MSDARPKLVVFDEALIEARDYWLEKLGRLSEPASIKLDYPRPDIYQREKAAVDIPLGPETCRKLIEITGGGDFLLLTILMAALKICLYKYTSESVIVVGSPIPGDRANSAQQSNVLPIVDELDRRKTFKQLLIEMRQTLLDAYARPRYPFDRLLDDLGRGKINNRCPLFQTALELTNIHCRLPELKNDLTLTFTKEESLIRGWIEFNKALFKVTTVERFASHFCNLLDHALINTAASIDELQVMSEQERRVILFDWNDTARDYPDKTCLHQLFEQQAEQLPDATALIFNEGSITYRELDQATNRLAHHLQHLGVGPEVKVGILMDRSPEMIVAVLAINKAGGAYVPFDTAWPSDRVEWILSSLNVSCLITQRAHLRAVHDVQWALPNLNDVVCLDVPDREPAPESSSVESLSIWDDLAETAGDRVTSGGFTSSYTGELFAEAEVDEYVSRVVELAQLSADESSRVLEIGCGSGLVMFEMAPKVATYVGLDQSSATQERNREYIARNDISNVELVTGMAHEIDVLTNGRFDLIIVASTAQFFPGPIYFEQVIKKMLSLLEPGGAILLADVMDARRRREFKDSLIEYKSQHPEARTKTDLSNELYFDEAYFYDLREALPELDEAIILKREHGFDNELRFRYDVVLKKTGLDTAHNPKQGQRRKRLWTAWHVNNQQATRPHTSVTSDNVAYIMFTSGSTGTPKGVVITHKAIVNTIDWVNRTFEVGPGDRLLFVTSFCFDLSVYDIFGVLGAGATIRIASKADLRNPQRLAQILIDDAITFWDSAPASLQQTLSFFPAFKSNGERHLRLVFLSGDWIPLSLHGEIREAFPQAKMIGLGGVTEASIWQSYFPVTEIKQDWVSVPYGRPIQNTRYHILDSSMNACPVDVAGDLYIGGTCLASGYTDSVQTADRFVPDPFSIMPGSRLYRTGDRARYWDDGIVEFLGRLDHQVKIRGFRIETGEIETVLAQHPAVKQCLVVAREDTPGDKRLVAYVIFNEQSGAGAGELRSFVREKVPDYMVPSAFVTLDKWPLSSNGKLDRKALPTPDNTRPDVGKAYSEPATETEATLAAIWTEILGIQNPGTNDNFFELGGHSLLATRVLSRIAQEFQVSMSLRSFFEMPTISGMARGIDAQTRVESEAADSLVHQQMSEAPLSYAQNQIWVAEQLEPGTPTFNIPFAVRLSGALDIPALRKSFDRIVARHDVLRVTFAVKEKGVVQVVATKLNLSLPVVDLTGLGDTEREMAARQIADQEAQRPFDLRKGPLLRAMLLRLSDREHVALLTMHHIISDGWSIGVLVGELTAFYKAEITGEPPAVGDLSVQYTDFARWQRRRLNGKQFEEMLDYWKRQLAGVPPALRLVSESERGKDGLKRAAQVVRLMPSDLAEQLNVLGRQENATLFMTLVSAFTLLLHYHSGQTDIVVGTDIANRNLVETEQLIGLFVNQLVLRTDLSGDPTWRELLAQLRQVTLDAYANQEVPFEKLVERLKPLRVEGRKPIFQAKIVLQNAPTSALDLPGLKLEIMGTVTGETKDDLLLSVTEMTRSLRAQMTFNLSLFGSSWATRFLEQLEMILAEVALNPDVKLKELTRLLAESDNRLQALKEQQLGQARQKSLNKIRSGSASRPRQNATK